MFTAPAKCLPTSILDTISTFVEVNGKMSFNAALTQVTVLDIVASSAYGFSGIGSSYPLYAFSSVSASSRARL